MDITQYLKYYIGHRIRKDARVSNKSEAIIKDIGILTGLQSDFAFVQFPVGTMEVLQKNLKPIVRRLSSITEEELIEFIKLERNKDIEITEATMSEFYGNIHVNYRCKSKQRIGGQVGGGMSLNNYSPKQFDFLISLGIWLFGDEAFESGAVIDAATIHP